MVDSVGSAGGAGASSASSTDGGSMGGASPGAASDAGSSFGDSLSSVGADLSGGTDVGGLGADGMSTDGGTGPGGFGDPGATGLGTPGTSGLSSGFSPAADPGTPSASFGSFSQASPTGVTSLAADNLSAINSPAVDASLFSSSPTATTPAATSFGTMPSGAMFDATPIAEQPLGPATSPVAAAPSLLDPTPIAEQPVSLSPIGYAPDLLSATPVANQALGPAPTEPVTAMPNLLDPTPIAEQPVSLSPIGLTPDLLNPTTIAERGLAPAPDLPAALLDPTPIANQPGQLTPPAFTDALLDPAPLGPAPAFATPVADPTLAQTPPQIGYGDRPLGVPLSEISSMTPEAVRAVVGEHIAAWSGATGIAQDNALQRALDAAYAYRVQGGDVSAFDRIAADVAGDPRAEVMTQVARDRAEAIVNAGVAGNIRAMNNNGINFGAQLQELQRNLGNNPDDAYATIGRALDVLQYGPDAASGANLVQLGALKQTVTSLGYGRELQDLAMAEAMRTEQAYAERQAALAQMTPQERMAYMAGQLMDNGALLAAGTGLAMGMAAGPRYQPGVATGAGTPLGTGSWLAGGAQGPTPAAVADALRGKNFATFDRYRESYWQAVAATPDLARQFSPANRALMERGLSPFAPRAQQLGGQTTYHLHHDNPIARGGAVYDADNIHVVSPMRHNDIHRGR